MKIGSNQRPVSGSTESTSVNTNIDIKKSAVSKKAVDTMTDARADGLAANGNITRYEYKNSEPKKVIQDGALTDDEYA